MSHQPVIKKMIQKTVLRTPQAVSRAEAGHVAPATESTKETLMPWRGWFSRLIEDRLGSERFQKYKKLLYYRPDDVHDLQQTPNPSTKVPLTDNDDTTSTGEKTAQFRFPSPGSQPPVRIPRFEESQGEDPYSTQYYTRDTARRYLDPANPGDPQLEELRLALLPDDDPRVVEAKEKLEEGPTSSPGNEGRFATGPTDYDPKGLRATMSASHASLNESLDAHMPDHLPRPEWWNKQEEIVAWYKERDLPVPMGATGWGLVPREGRIARW